MTGDPRAELRVAAEKATPGPWRAEADWDSSVDTHVVYVLGPERALLATTQTADVLSEGDALADAAFIAAASPDVVLSLLDDLADAHRTLEAAADLVDAPFSRLTDRREGPVRTRCVEIPLMAWVKVFGRRPSSPVTENSSESGFTMKCSYCDATVTLPSINGRLQLAALATGWTLTPDERRCPVHSENSSEETNHG